MNLTACVTGADRGLGHALTKWMLENNCKVFAGRYMEDWPFLDQLKSKFPDQLELIPLDIGKDESVKSAARSISSKTNHLDMIINNAGIIYEDDEQLTILEDLNFEAMRNTYNVNSLGPLRVTNALIDLLLKGSMKLVVNISSEAGSVKENKRMNWYGYCMSKSALNMQSSILHKHLQTMGGQVMIFRPGWLQSYMSGALNKEATVPTEEAANKIMHLVQNHKEY